MENGQEMSLNVSIRNSHTAALALRLALVSAMTVVRTGRSAVNNSVESSEAPNWMHNKTEQYAACVCSSPFPFFKQRSNPSWIVNFLCFQQKNIQSLTSNQ